MTYYKRPGLSLIACPAVDRGSDSAAVYAPPSSAISAGESMPGSSTYPKAWKCPICDNVSSGILMTCS